jgi:organic radical activating enzyme
MVLFGKEIKLETNMSPKEAKLSLLIISLAVVIILGYFQIFIPIMDIKNLNNEIEMKKSEKIGEETKKKAAQREYCKKRSSETHKGKFVSKDTKRHEFISAVDLVSKDIKLVIQPDTNGKNFLMNIFEFYNLATKKIKDVRILPQMHKIWKVR